MKYVCDVCGYVYDEALGDPDNGIAPGTKWEDIPEDFVCPLCGVGKDQFSAEQISENRFSTGREGLTGSAVRPSLFFPQATGRQSPPMALPTCWTTERWVSSKRCM